VAQYPCCVSIVSSHSVITNNCSINYRTDICTVVLCGNLVNNEVVEGKTKDWVGRIWSFDPKRPLEMYCKRRQFAFQQEMQTSRLP
jgi:hypothetical protein